MSRHPAIAYLGPEGTNAHHAAQARFGTAATYLHAPTVEDVFRLVERRQAEFGVVPIENSLEGAVTHTLDRFIDFVDTPVTIHGEMQLAIHHALILSRRARLTDIKVVYSHPQALAQCHRWLRQHLPKAALRETNSTAEAVADVLENAAVRAAIGRKELTASSISLRALPIPDERENKTRFLIIGLGQAKKGRAPARRSSSPGRANKTSILFAVKDQPGALYDALVPFRQHKINLTKIESRPSKRKAWEYLFFIDLVGHVSEPRVTRALAALGRTSSLMRVLGSYPVTGKA